MFRYFFEIKEYEAVFYVTIYGFGFCFLFLNKRHLFLIFKFFVFKKHQLKIFLFFYFFGCFGVNF